MFMREIVFIVFYTKLTLLLLLILYRCGRGQ